MINRRSCASTCVMQLKSTLRRVYPTMSNGQFRCTCRYPQRIVFYSLDCCSATSEPKGPVYLWARREMMEQEIDPSLLETPMALTKWPSVQPTALQISGTVSRSRWYSALTWSVSSGATDCGRPLGCNITPFDHIPPWTKPSGVSRTRHTVAHSCASGFSNLSLGDQLAHIPPLPRWILLLDPGDSNATS